MGCFDVKILPGDYVSKKDLLLARLIEIAHSVEHSGHGLALIALGQRGCSLIASMTIRTWISL
jgi:hypothetical protein